MYSVSVKSENRDMTEILLWLFIGIMAVFGSLLFIYTAFKLATLGYLRGRAFFEKQEKESREVE